MSKFDLPDDMPRGLKDLIIEARETGIWKYYNLQPYSTKTLEKGLKYLEDNNQYVTLQRELRHEINARKDNVKPIPTQTTLWFPEMWWAVMSLFGKGEMNRNEKRTKDILSRIDPAWRNNCGARL